MRTTTSTPRTGGFRTYGAVAALIVMPMAVAACGDDDEGSGGPTATLRAPEDGATVAGGLAVDMLASGLTIEAAGESRDGAGHFHVIVDGGCVEEGTTVPKDANHVHFGTGATTGTVYLAPGEHELCLQVADGEHTATDISDTATVTVAIRTLDEWCAVIAETDVLLTEADTGDAEFAVDQVTYGNAGRLLAQLSDALDVVDADAREMLAEAITFVSEIGDALTSASDEEAATAAVEEIFADFGDANEDDMAEATIWVFDTCGVNLDG